jgi:hypothetical protein
MSRATRYRGQAYLRQQEHPALCCDVASAKAARLALARKASFIFDVIATNSGMTAIFPSLTSSTMTSATPGSRLMTQLVSVMWCDVLVELRPDGLEDADVPGSDGVNFREFAGFI